ncbi:type 2 lactosamine alpha-2,3-sialyltransferase [Pimephales promelas]|nr:type 2 lactosamine alpha-2,3-sialyltransferase [Pimephales promelas]
MNLDAIPDSNIVRATSEVKKAVDLIPKPKSSILLPVPEGSKDGCIRCAVVGTGGILNNSKMGKEIDSHDYVFRVNGAVTQGYEEDVGNRTSVYVHTAFSLYASMLSLKNKGFHSVPQDEGIKYVMIPEGLRDFEWLQGLLQGKVANGPVHTPAGLKLIDDLRPHQHFYLRMRIIDSERNGHSDIGNRSPSTLQRLKMRIT